jgi:PhnB protein
LVNPIPHGYHSITPYLVVDGAQKLIAFLKVAFDAHEINRTSRPDGTIMNAELRIGDSMLMLGDARGVFKSMPTTLYLYVPDTDSVYRRAITAGAISLMEPADQFYGDRNAGVQDPCGNLWWIATHIEDISPDELHRRAAARGGH